MVNRTYCNIVVFNISYLLLKGGGKNNMFGICWHKWKYVYQEFPDIFLGERIKNQYVRFRICEKCGKAEELVPTYDNCFWDTLNDTKARILKKKIVDKGDYYILQDKSS